MKTTVLAAVVAMGLTPVGARASECPEASELAVGYAEAFRAMRRLTVVIHYQAGPQTERLERIKDVQAWGGALLVRDVAGNRQVLDASRVIRITDH